ncbi:MAG TPA: CRISPR-associated protein Cas6 [Cyanobacteria bacterium UBA8803]|nr:CRISPR-associated protein Cas6 [Cyanobacteria bacterium UBA9273]HBL57419.1 CRISPR-associated protein Cas6 [Cyanobacteria bacterium UBA8803]
MTSTNASEPGIAGLSVVLRWPADAQSTPLTHWLPEGQHTPVWIPQRQRDGVIRIMAALSQSKYYPTLIEHLCQQINQTTTVEWRKKSYCLTGIEIYDRELHLLQIPVFAAQALPANLGRALHALCLHWLSLADATLAAQLHQQNTLPFSIAIQTISPKQIYLRVGLLQKELLSPLLWGISQNLGREITLTDIPCRLGKWVELLHASSFELLSQVPPSKAIELQFLSPTSFKQGQCIQPFPLPELVFANLLRRWNTFAPAAWQFPALEWQGLTCAYDLKTQVINLKGGPEIGTTGWVRYEFRDREQSAIATTLAHFAQFAGVGRKTGMGMGQVFIR